MSEQNQKPKKNTGEGQLPSITELYNEPKTGKQQDQLNELLNQPPMNNWLKDHPTAKSVKYIPVERIEWLLTQIFQKWIVEIIDYKIIANAVAVSVRLWYKNPLNGEWLYQDGGGAQVLQTKAGSGAVDFNNLNSNAVQLAFPAAISFAEKNAAAKIGKLFGRDLNRDQISYQGISNRISDIEIKSRKLQDAISKMDESEEKTRIIADINEAEDTGNNTLEFYNEMLAKINRNEN